jgi:hypothetical protein
MLDNFLQGKLRRSHPARLPMKVGGQEAATLLREGQDKGLAWVTHNSLQTSHYVGRQEYGRCPRRPWRRDISIETSPGLGLLLQEKEIDGTDR